MSETLTKDQLYASAAPAQAVFDHVINEVAAENTAKFAATGDMAAGARTGIGLTISTLAAAKLLLKVEKIGAGAEPGWWELLDTLR
jgi:hypothetical protein